MLSLGRWNAGTASNYDLGIFAQSAQSWSRFELPYSGVRDLNLLGEHFSPILAVLGLAWMIWPDPRVLLVCQALLFAVPFGMMVKFATSQVSKRWIVAGLILLGLTSRAVLSAVLFDFHEVAFVPLSLVIMCFGLIRRKFAYCVAAAVGLILIKEDLGATVIAAAFIWWLGNRRDLRRPAILAAIGAIGIVVALVTILYFSGDAGANYLERMGTPSSGFGNRIGSLPSRLLPTGFFIICTLVIGLRSPLVLLALPTIAWRAISSLDAYWTLYFHYDLVFWPVAFLAIVQVVSQRRQAFRPLTVAVIVLSVVANLALTTMGLLDRAASPSEMFRTSAAVSQIRALGNNMPAGSSVATQDQVGPYLISDFDVTMLKLDSTQPVKFAMFTTTTPSWATELRAPLCSRLQLIEQAKTLPGWRIWTSGETILIEFPGLQVPGLQDC